MAVLSGAIEVRTTMTTHVPRGGPATINGVLYQMLWSLLQTARVHVEVQEAEGEPQEIQSAQLILEPRGGDLQRIQGAARIVEQLKSRPADRTWSFRNVVEDVLPDLYRAVDFEKPDSRYRFVTEGRMGRWTQPYAFFRSLHARDCPETDIPSVLDASKPIRFSVRRPPRPEEGGDSPGRWECGEYTERSLFNGIVEALREHKLVGEEPIELTQGKLWHLLERFEFIGSQTAGRLRQEVDSLLLAVVERREDVPEKRRALLTALAEKATGGAADIDAEQFLKECGLDATPLTRWLTIRSRANDLLRRWLRRRGHDPTLDVRRSTASALVREWRSEKPLLVISGESGQGKSWFSYGVAEAATADEGVTIAVEARGDADADLRAAADVFWQQIAQHDGSLSLERLAARRRDVVPERAEPWLTMLVDGVQDFTEARRLALADWRAWGVRVVITCSPEVTAAIHDCAPRDTCHVFPVSDFTVSELQDYLWSRLGDDWPDVPGDVRETLRRPLLAHIYCEECETDAGWQPTNEYELYARCWSRLRAGSQSRWPHDEVHLAAAASEVFLSEASYPWRPGQLEDAGLDAEAITRLCQIGWLRATRDGRYEIWHDRLLNWAVAEGLVGALSSNRMTLEELTSALREFSGSRWIRGGRFMGYVPLDLLWLLADPKRGPQENISPVLEALESNGDLYDQTLATLGPRIVPALFVRLQEVGGAGDEFVAWRIVDVIARFAAPDVSSSAAALLGDDSETVVRAAQRILSKHPIAEALDRLWELHCALLADQHAPHAYKDSFAALKAAVRLDPGWLRCRIDEATPSEEPVHDLAYLVANLDDSGRLWRGAKATLHDRVPASKRRALIMNIWRHRDQGEIHWLKEQTRSNEEFIAGSAFGALVTLDPDAALDVFDQVPVRALAGLRHQGFAVLLARRDHTLQRMLKRMRSAEQPWDLAGAFAGYENSISPQILDILLDAFAAQLTEIPEDRPPGPPTRLFRPLLFLAVIHRLDLLECFEARRGTSLEEDLTAWLIERGPRRSLWLDREARDALLVLQKIGGSGFTMVVNHYLDSDTHFGRMDGLRVAFKAPDEQTTGLLAAITHRDDLVQGFPMEQSYATRALALSGAWQRVIESVVRWGPKTSPDLMEHRHGQPPLDDEVVRPALESLNARDECLPGAILALGAAGRTEHRETIRTTLSESDPDSDLAIACMLALDDLRDKSPETEVLFVRQLGVPKRRHVAVRALFGLATENANAALLESLRDGYDDMIALGLLQNPNTREAAARAMWNELQRPKRSGMVDFHIEHFGHLDDDEVRDFLRDRAFADEGSFCFTGSKASAIRGVAIFDRDLAFLAAKKALQNPDHHDRQLYPGLLAEIDAERAIPELLALAAREDSEQVLQAIGRALPEDRTSMLVVEWLASDDVNRRCAAVRLAGILPADGGDVDDLLRDYTVAQSDDLAKAALTALFERENSHEVDQLVTAAHAEPDGPRKWLLIDSTVSLGDVGRKDDPDWPDWAKRLVRDMPHLVARHIGDQVRQRRDGSSRRSR